MFVFSGLRMTWHGTRGSNCSPRPGEHQLFEVLTTEPDGVVKLVHPKAMPVILTTRKETAFWLNADWTDAQALQKPLADDELVCLVEQ